MKQLVLILVIFLPTAIFAQGLPCAPSDGCRCLIEKADAILTQKDGDYQQALYLYFAAQACDESLIAEAEEKILALFDKIENLKTTAENRAILIQQQQRQLIAEKEAAESATRKVTAQNLNNLAGKAILKEDMAEAFRLMQYANVYDPDNPLWLNNCQELFARNSIGYPTEEYLNLLPTKIYKPVNNIAGVIHYSGKFISWGNDGSLTAWDNKGKVEWTNKYDNPIIGMKQFEGQSSLISWDENGIIRIHDLNGNVEKEFDHESKPKEIFLFEDGTGFLAWSSQRISTWKKGEAFINRTETKEVTNVLKRKIGKGFMISFRDNTLQFWDASGTYQNFIPNIENATFGLYELSDSTFLSLNGITYGSYTNQGDRLELNSDRRGHRGAMVVPDTGYILWGLYSLKFRLEGADQNPFDVYLSNKSIINTVPLPNLSGFLAWLTDGQLIHYSWDGEHINYSNHKTTISDLKYFPEKKLAIYFTEGDFIYVRNIDSGKLVAKIKSREKIIDIDLDSTSSQLFWVTDRGSANFLEIFNPPPSRIYFARYAPKFLPYPNLSGLLHIEKHKIEKINLQGKISKSILELDKTIHFVKILEGQRGYMALTDAYIYYWNWQDELVSKIETNMKAILFKQLPGQDVIFALSPNDGIKFWNFSGELIKHIQVGNNLRGHCIMPDQNRIAVWDMEGTINVWTLDGIHYSGPFPTFNDHKDVFYLDKNGLLLSYNQSGKVVIWDSKGNIKLEKDFGIEINNLLIHPDNQSFFFWDDSGNLFKSDFQGDFSTLLSLGSEINRLRFMEDQKSFITTTESGQVACWNERGSLISQFTQNLLNKQNVKIEPIPTMNAYLAWSSSRGERFFIWSTSPTDILKTGNNIGIPDFTDEEKRKYGIDLDVVVDREYTPYPWLRE